MSDVITSASYSNIESTWQNNSRNLNQVIKFTTVLQSPLISFLVGPSLGFDSFEAILHKDFNGKILNAMEDFESNVLDRYQLVSKSDAHIDDYVKFARDNAPAFALTPSGALAASATADLLSVTENGAYICQEGVRLYNPRTHETLIVLSTANGNNNIQVQRAANGSTVGTITTTDTLIAQGIALDLNTPQVTASRPIPRRRDTLYNGFRRLFTPGTPVTNAFREETLLYNGQFLDYLSEELQRAHKAQLINSLIYERYGDHTTAEKNDPTSNINKFNGYQYWADQNSVTAGFSGIGAMDGAKFESLMTWWETYDGLGTREAPMVYICGPTAYKALQPFLQQGVLVTTDEGYVPGVMGSRVQRYNTGYGKQVYICVDTYLQEIGRGGDIIMCAEDNLTLFIGRDDFLTPKNPNVAGATRGMLPGASRFCQFIKDYSVEQNTRTDMMISQYSLLPAYVELCSMATGITLS